MHGYQLSLPSIVFSEFDEVLFFSSDVYFSGNVCEVLPTAA